MTPRILMLLTLPLVLFSSACSTTFPNRNPVGETFPTVTGSSLHEESVTLPTAYEGEPALYMVGYVQATQFDLDRWAIGLTQVKFPCRIVEVPAIPNAVASMFQGMIDNGMRSGIPREDWASVVTLYGGAAEPVACVRAGISAMRLRARRKCYVMPYRAMPCHAMQRDVT